MPADRLALVTRPEPGASDTAERLRARGWQAVVSPVIRVLPRAITAPGHVQAVLLTSANAVPALPPLLRGETVLAVGDATAARARAAGFADVRSAGADAQALTSLVQMQCAPSQGALLLATGEGQGQALAAALRAVGFAVVRRVAYATVPAPALTASALTALRQRRVAAALVFSPESGRRLVRLLHDASVDVAAVEALAISEAAASPLFLLPWARIRVASHPDQDSLLGLLP